MSGTFGAMLLAGWPEQCIPQCVTVCQGMLRTRLHELRMLELNSVSGKAMALWTAVCSNLIQSKLVSSQVRNYRGRRSCGFCLFIWFKYAARAKIRCQMENSSWGVLKNIVPKESPLCHNTKSTGLQSPVGSLWSGLNHSLQILEKLPCITSRSLASTDAQHKPNYLLL